MSMHTEKMNRDPYWVSRNPIVSVGVDIVPHGGPDDLGAFIGRVIRARDGSHGSAGCISLHDESRLFSADEFYSGAFNRWVRDVLYAQHDLIATQARRDAEVEKAFDSTTSGAGALTQAINRG